MSFNKSLLTFLLVALLQSTCPVSVVGQAPPYDKAPEAKPPYYRVRYEPSNSEHALRFPVQYTVWIPTGVDSLLGVIVHQHGCGPGSCQSGLTGAYDLHWQALARKHSCALLAASYEQPDKENCRFWCDPRNGSDEAFQKGLADLGKQAGHPELAEVPWALWGHSGGGFWSGGMTLLHPNRVAAAFLRSGSPPLESDPSDPNYVPYVVSAGVSEVPIMINLGTEEGYSVTDNRFAQVWPRSRKLLNALREQGGLAGVSVDPLTGHQCGNQRYFAIAWLDECLTHRLADQPGKGLRPMPTEHAWLSDIFTKTIRPASKADDATKLGWLPNERTAKAWLAYVRDTKIPDETPPPAPTRVVFAGDQLTWNANADLQSGIKQFVVFKDGDPVARVPETPKNPFGRPLFQGLLYSDTPTRPLQEMKWSIPDGSEPNAVYRVATVNTVGLQSQTTTAINTSEEKPASTSDAVHLFVLSGQSNMAGLKPEESFTPTVEAEFGAENVVICKLAVGGQPIRRWDEGWVVGKGDNPKQIGDLYTNLIAQVRQKVGERPLRSVTFAWMQGERDAREAHSDVYAASFNRVLDQLRTDMDHRNINFVIGRLSDYGTEQKQYPDWTKMRTVLVELADSSPRGAWVNTDDLNDGLNRRGKPITNDLHYSAEGYVTFGKRLADESIRLIRKHETNQ